MAQSQPQQSAQPTAQPMRPTAQPMRPTAQPMRPTAQPMRPTAQPAQPGQAPGEGNKGLGTFFRGGMNAVREERAQRQQAQAAAQQPQAQQPAAQPRQERQMTEDEADRLRDQRNQEAIEGVDVVRGRAIWNILPGQIARKISERELEEIDRLKGIIVQEGCTAVIYANGELVSTLSGGAYLFYKSAEEEEAALKAAIKKAEQELDEKERRINEQRRQAQPTFSELGIVGEIGRAAGWVRRLVFGEKKGESKQKVERRQIDYARIMGKITKAPVMSVYIVSERHLPMVFNGKEDAEGNMQFVPMAIPTKLVDVNMAVSLQLKITDVFKFVQNYLQDKSSATAIQFQRMLQPVVENTLRQSVRNLDYDSVGLPEPIIENLKNKIKDTINQHLYGIECTQVLQITDSSTEFDRFRAVERELFCSEKELGFLQRTGEFRNRLAIETNSQAINEATNKEDLRYALQKINKDELLHKDEMEEFVNLLESQKRLREATTQEQEYEALSDLRKNRLVKDDEVDALQNAMLNNKLQRDSITEVMRITSQQSVDEARLRSEISIADQRQVHELEMRRRQDNFTFEQRRREDDYSFEQRQRDDNYSFEQRQREDSFDFSRRQRDTDLEWQQTQRQREMERQDEAVNYERTRIDRQDELEALERRARIAQMNMAAMNQHEQQMAAMNHQTEQMRINAQTQMSAEQIAASQMAGLDAAAQAELARTMGSGRENELLRQQQAQQAALYQQMMQMQQQQGAQSQQQMMEMMRMMQQGMMGMAQQNAAFQQQRYEDQQQRANEYRQDAYRQQDRVDAVSQQAMDYTTRNPQQPAPQQAPQPARMMYCPNCAGEVAENATFCPHCGQQFA